MKIKIAFTGPESSGKTTISKAIATETKGIWVEEYARHYLHFKKKYCQEDLDKITQGQLEKWLVEGQLIVADTEITVIKIWSEYRYRNCSNAILDAYRNQNFDHYFLCKPDIPWQEDPLRENPNNRDELFEIYLTELTSMARPFTILEGSINNRLKVCRIVLSSLGISLN